MNRRGDLIIRFIVLAVSVLVVTYMGVQIYSWLVEPVRTTLAILSTFEETAESVGIFVRNENLIQKQGDVYELLVDEGDRVSRDQAIAEVYSDQSALSRAAQLDSIDEQIRQLEFARGASSDILVAGRQNDQIYEALFAVLNETCSGEFSRLGRLSLQLKSLVLRREYMYSNPAGLEKLLAELKQQRAELAGSAGAGIMQVRTVNSGTFCAQVDGFESLIQPAKLDTITGTELNRLLSDNSVKDTSKWLGKVMHDFDWYFATIMSADDALKLSVGSRVTIRFSPGLDFDIAMRVTRIDTDESGKSVVVLTSSEALTSTMSLRRQNAEIVYQTLEGVRIPREAVRVSDDGTTGVYAVSGVMLRFKPIEIIHDTGSYYLVKYTPELKNALRPGDEVVVAGKDLFDGKIVR